MLQDRIYHCSHTFSSSTKQQKIAIEAFNDRRYVCVGRVKFDSGQEGRRKAAKTIESKFSSFSQRNPWFSMVFRSPGSLSRLELEGANEEEFSSLQRSAREHVEEASSQVLSRLQLNA